MEKLQIGVVYTKFKFYAKDGAKYLSQVGFDDRFCRICEGVNRYSGLEPREPESDILEIVDNLGVLLLNKEDNSSYNIGQAMQILINEKLKDVPNRYINEFKEFIYKEEGVTV